MSGQEWTIGSEDLRGQVTVSKVVRDGVEGPCHRGIGVVQSLSGSREKPELGPVKGLSEMPEDTLR